MLIEKVEELVEWTGCTKAQLQPPVTHRSSFLSTLTPAFFSPILAALLFLQKSMRPVLSDSQYQPVFPYSQGEKLPCLSVGRDPFCNPNRNWVSVSPRTYDNNRKILRLNIEGQHWYSDLEKATMLEIDGVSDFPSCHFQFLNIHLDKIISRLN